MTGYDPANLYLGKAALYQLSYIRMERTGVFIPLRHVLRAFEQMTGLEPATFRLEI